MVEISAERVTRHTAPEVQADIDRRIECDVAWFGEHPERIDDRLRELDREWDVERTLETVSSSLTLTGLAMALLGRRRALVLPIAVQAFFLQHALQGWCPPLPLLRRLGVRTRAEIDRERFALKALRGDFRELGSSGNGDALSDARRALRAMD